MEKNVAIVGGGIGGLTAGYLLSKKGFKVTVLEKEKSLGGLMGTFDLGDEKIEKLYHHIFKSDKEIIRIIKDLKLDDKLKWHKSSVGLYYDGKMYPFVTPIDLLKFKPLKLIDKIRTGLVALYLQHDEKWEKYEKVAAYKWMEKWAGENAYKVIWEPLLKGKFHDYYKDVSMAWLWARIHTRGGSKDEKGNEMLGYIDGGFGLIADELAKFIKEKGGKIKLNTEVNNLSELENEFDFIIDTRPTANVQYLGAVDVVFTSKQNLSSFYWHNINDTNSPFLAFIQHTNLIDKSNYGNKNVYYMGTYVPQDNELFSMSDKSIENRYFEYLRKIFPEFKRDKVIETKVFRFKHAQHLVDLKYRNKIPPYKQTEKIFNLNFAQIYPEDRGINYAVKDAMKVVEMIK